MAIFQLATFNAGRTKNVNPNDSGRILSIYIGTSGDSTELTKAILDKLILIHNTADADGSYDSRYYTETELDAGQLDTRYYTETELDAGQLDNRYFTETELGSTADGASGASLIGVDQTPAFTNISGATVQAIIESIDSALGTAGSNEFADDVFRVTGSVDATKKIALEADGITTGTTRTITMPDSDVNLGDIATNASNISTNASNITSNDTDISNLQGALGSATEAAINYSSNNYVADATDAVTAIGALDAQVGTNASNISTNASNISTNSSNISSNDTDIADLVTLSGVAANSTNLGTFSGTTISDAQTLKAALQDLETALENQGSAINNFEFYNSALDYVVDNTAAPATEVSGDRYILSHDGGAPNAAYDGASAGDVVEFDGSVWVATSPATGAFIAADDESDKLYQWSGSAWVAKYFEATTASTGLTKVGFDIQLADAAANTGAISVSSGAIQVEVDDSTIERASNAIQLKDGGITDAKINASAAIQTSKLADSAELSEAVTFFGATDISGAEAETLTDGSNADALHSHSITTSSYTSTAVAIADGAAVRVTSGGLIEAAQADTEAKALGSIGVANGAIGISSAGEAVRLGKKSIPAGQIEGSAFTVGQEVYLSDLNAGKLTSTAPSSAGTAVVLMGIASSSTELDAQPPVLLGVN